MKSMCTPVLIWVFAEGDAVSGEEAEPEARHEGHAALLKKPSRHRFIELYSQAFNLSLQDLEVGFTVLNI